ncbi:uncharacterized protein LOC130719584 [Lotus japonicus]|uniref:uncharacterized protein LOC130719584 n=1 Tax=Lotus japonicus TaxID=34305 RepID=UPI00258542C7|nr:uncharacterized protein LOC130719584 [Lotus japonicus]
MFFQNLIPISINEISTYNLRHDSPKVELLKKASLIIWDEALILNIHCFEALNRSLNDIIKTRSTYSYDIPFRGKVVVLGGDFRQILSVISKGSCSEIVGSAINSSYLWKYCKVMKLTVNMILQNANSSSSSAEIKEFADWLFQVGDGTVTTIDEAESLIEIPPDLLIEPCKDPLLEIVNFSYPKLLFNLEKNSFFQERAILAPTLESVEEINNFMLAMIPGEEIEYLSCDTPCKFDEDSGVNTEWFTSEFLNDYKCSGIPNHQIKLKVGVPIMLIRNIDQAARLCNDTRMIVNVLTKYIIVATVLNGNTMGETTFIPRMSLPPSNSNIPFKFQCSINKWQAAYWSSNLKDNFVAIRLCCSNIELVEKFNFKSEVIITKHGQQVLLSDHVVDIFVIF